MLLDGTLRSLADVAGCDVVVNCTGLGAIELVGDRELHPLRGQVVEITCDAITEFSFDADAPQGATYVIPRMDSVILGGTTEFSADTRPRDESTTDILDRCSALDPRVRGAAVVGVKVGLRPARSTVRLEVDHEIGRVPVVHNYGHGGAGITVSWGCAEEVAAIVAGLPGW
jgi:D-amino-acid oxidase